MMEGVEVINPNPPPSEKKPVILFSGSYGESQKEDAKVKKLSHVMSTKQVKWYLWIGLRKRINAQN